MGFDYHYQGGDLHIPSSQFPNLVALVPVLVERHNLSEEVIQQEIVDYREYAQEWRKDILALPEEMIHARCVLNLVARKNYWNADFIYTGIWLHFDTMHSGDTSEWLDEIAPLLAVASYVQIVDDDYRMWRLVVRPDSRIETIYPTWKM